MKYIKFYLLFILTVGFSQNEFKNEFVEDSLNHRMYVNSFIENLKNENVKDVICLFDYNFVSNDTYIYWLSNNKLLSRKLSNKKLKKRIKNRKLRVYDEQSKALTKLFDSQIEYSFLKDYKNCESDISHHYNFSIFIDDKEFKINSKCIPKLKKNETIKILFEIIDDNN